MVSQRERSATTRGELITAATALFAEHGYHDVSAQQIVDAARLTRGAMYHHFTDKRALFRAVFEQLEQQITAEIGQHLDAEADPTTRVALALGQFLDICQRPTVTRIALTDAPAVLGWTQWRAIEAEHGLGLVVDGLQRIADEGRLVFAPVEVLAQLVLSAVIEAALMITHSADRPTARADATGALLALVGGLLIAPAT